MDPESRGRKSIASFDPSGVSSLSYKAHRQ